MPQIPSFSYGPFAPPRSKWLPLFALALLAPLFVGLGTQAQELSCSRKLGTCRHLQSSALFGASERSFAIEQVREVRFVDKLGKNQRDAESVLVFASGHELRLARGGHDDARARFEEIERFFQPGGGPELRFERRGSPLFLILGVALGAALIGFVGHLLGFVLPFRVTLSRDRLHVRQLPFGRPREVELAKPKRVKILKQASGLSRVVIRTSGGEVPLTVRAFGGRRVHERAARRVAEQLELDYAPAEPAAPAALPARSRKPLLLFAALLIAGVLISALTTAVSSRTQGTLELECRTRCRFQGMECLPGGGVQMSLDPGAHTIEVWAARGQARWTPKQATIRAGEITRFVCEQ